MTKQSANSSSFASLTRALNGGLFIFKCQPANSFEFVSPTTCQTNFFFCNCHLVNSTNEVELDWVGVIYRNSFPCPLEQAKKFTFLTAPNLSPGKAVTTHHLHNRHGYSTAWLIITSIVTTWCFSLGLHMEKFKTRNLSLLQKLQCCHNLVILKHTNKLIFFSSRTICSATREDRYAFRREG